VWEIESDVAVGLERVEQIEYRVAVGLERVEQIEYRLAVGASVPKHVGAILM
jgi:hypothetical protein